MQYHHSERKFYMSSIEKRINKFYRKPIPNDITLADVETVAAHFGCTIVPGGSHLKVVYKLQGTVISIPRHGKCIKEIYVKKLKDLFESIKEENHEV